jgi:hypothetical protein
MLLNVSLVYGYEGEGRRPGSKPPIGRPRNKNYIKKDTNKLSDPSIARVVVLGVCEIYAHFVHQLEFVMSILTSISLHSILYTGIPHPVSTCAIYDQNPFI